MKSISTLTLRLNPDVYEKTKEIAKREGRSMSSFIGDLLKKRLAEEEEKRLFDAFTLISQETEETDVEFAADAQREVIEDHE